MKNQNRTKLLSLVGRMIRSFIKRYIYAQLAIYSGVKILLGIEDPFIRFTVEKDPPSTYWVFKIRPAVLNGLEKVLGIPEGFAISPIRCLTTDEPEYLLVMNAYRVSGLANGLRAEWSTFIHGINGVPRYMILDAGSTQLSMDPIHIFTRGLPLQHELIGNKIVTQYGSGDRSFHSSLDLQDEPPRVHASTEWVSANDNIYWKNGVYDHTFYNAGLADAHQVCIPIESATIELGAFWQSIVEKEPSQILVMQDEIEFVLSPWKNIHIVTTQ